MYIGKCKLNFLLLMHAKSLMLKWILCFNIAIIQLMDHWMKNLETRLKNVLNYLPLFMILNKDLNLLIILTEV